MLCPQTSATSTPVMPAHCSLEGVDEHCSVAVQIRRHEGRGGRVEQSDMSGTALARKCELPHAALKINRPAIFCSSFVLCSKVIEITAVCMMAVLELFTRQGSRALRDPASPRPATHPDMRA